ncbi:hypothetical protein ABW19_dt0208706 [Dactylella cylindrospora]|nr:hypothetical protein ABW19_dt0208706 [Dactylella cylindrospora]
MPTITVINETGETISVFVSTYTGQGDDSWFELAPGASDVWTRNDGWELVAAKNAGDNARQGRYVRTGSIVTFTGSSIYGYDFGGIEVVLEYLLGEGIDLGI